MEKSVCPILDSSNNSLELINEFLPNFYEYLRSQSGSIDSLLRLHKNGNDKASEIIKYLTGTPPVPCVIGDISNQMNLRQVHHKGISNYNLNWSCFSINDLIESQICVEFDFEANFDEEESFYMINQYIITAGHNSEFRNRFLLNTVIQWLKEKGFRLRRSNLKKNNGLLVPYVDLSLKYIDPRPDPDHLDKNWVGFAKKVIGHCLIQILPLE